MAKLIRVLHPGIGIRRYLICVETARVFSVYANRFTNLRKPLWLFSSLYWPLPKGWTVRVYDSMLYVFSARTSHRKLPTISKTSTKFVVKTKDVVITTKTRQEARQVARALDLDSLQIFTEKVVAVQMPTMLVSMFLGQERSSSVILNVFIERLTDAYCCQTAPT
jgi:hypothetical protein